jgi:predicted nucleic acid-binding protein
LEKGMKIIGLIDEKYVPFIATALSIKNDGI